MKSIGRLRTAALMCVAAFGLIVGHWLTYFWLAPDSAHRVSLLEQTGHGYMDSAVSVLGPLAFMALLFVVLMGSMQARAGSQPSLSSCAFLMGTVQVVGFGLQEVMERMISGASLADLGSVLSVGLMVQLAVAALATLLFIGLHKAGRIFGRMVRRSRFARPANRLPRPSQDFPLGGIAAFGTLRLRGPPALL